MSPLLPVTRYAQLRQNFSGNGFPVGRTGLQGSSIRAFSQALQLFAASPVYGRME